MAGKLNLVIDQGATYNKHFRMKDANGDAFDLSDYTMRAQIRKTYDGSLSNCSRSKCISRNNCR